LALNDGSIRYLEVYIKPEKDSENIAKTGVVFADSKIRILPCKSIDDAATTIQLKLSLLPMFDSDEVLEGLQKSLAMFGKIVDWHLY
jgi:hypothetical protein